MAVISQKITDKYAVYEGDCIETMKSFPKEFCHLSIYSPPFGGLYVYSSDDRDLSNNKDYESFFEHYEFVVKEIHRITLPGRMTAVHCADIPSGNCGCDHLRDFPGDIIRLHEKIGFRYTGRYCVWKEPLAVRNRTMAKNLAHKTIVDDSSKCSVASADYLLVFRRTGENKIPIVHPNGLTEYAGESENCTLCGQPFHFPPAEYEHLRGYEGNQIYNSYSHNIWRRYASAFWHDIRIGNVLPYDEARDPEDEKHVHPLQLDVIERAIVLWSNPGENVLTPFMGVGSEVYMAVKLDRKGLGIELKNTYYKQAIKNIDSIGDSQPVRQKELFDA